MGLAMALCVAMAAPSDRAESRGSCIDEDSWASKCAEIKKKSTCKTDALAKQHCRGTCNLCGDRAETERILECQDIKKDCKASDCKALGESECQKTCDKCAKSRGDCIDEDSWASKCAEIKKKSTCKTDALAKQHCRGTCNLC